MFKMTARLAALALCFAASGYALGDERQANTGGPQVLNDAELDAITAGALSVGFISVFNPGNVDRLEFTRPPFMTLNGGEPPPATPTSGSVFLITPGGHVVLNCIRVC